MHMQIEDDRSFSWWQMHFETIIYGPSAKWMLEETNMLLIKKKTLKVKITVWLISSIVEQQHKNRIIAEELEPELLFGCELKIIMPSNARASLSQQCTI